MSLAIKYENPDDARMRLRGTVVLYKETPVYITDVQRGETKDDILRVLFSELPVTPGSLGKVPFRDEEAGAKRKYISSKHFDIAPFKMGYVNRPNETGAFYTSRIPARVQKQGLCSENFRGINNSGLTVDFVSFIKCEEVNAMVAGKYPSFKTAVANLIKVPSVAFDYDFCLTKDEVIGDLIYLHHKGRKVGMYNQNLDCVVLGKSFTCLKEHLKELKVIVGD